MRVKLAYGREGLWVDLPDHADRLGRIQCLPAAESVGNAYRAEPVDPGAGDVFSAVTHHQ